MSKPWKTPVPFEAFLIAWLTNTECAIANLNSDFVAPACLTHQDTKTADQGTDVQLVNVNCISCVHFLICLQSAGSASFVRWNLVCWSCAIAASFLANVDGAGISSPLILSLGFHCWHKQLTSEGSVCAALIE